MTVFWLSGGPIDIVGVPRGDFCEGEDADLGRIKVGGVESIEKSCKIGGKQNIPNVILVGDTIVHPQTIVDQ